jgi:hypothetical protein
MAFVTCFADRVDRHDRCAVREQPAVRLVLLARPAQVRVRERPTSNERVSLGVHWLQPTTGQQVIATGFECDVIYVPQLGSRMATISAPTPEQHVEHSIRYDLTIRVTEVSAAHSEADELLAFARP